MKAITLHEPWASLIRFRRKQVETRGWPAPQSLIGRQIAIHAGKRADWDLAERWDVPCAPGHVVAIARLQWSLQVRAYSPAYDGGVNAVCSTTQGDVGVATDEYGDFSVGRWLWVLTDIVPLDPPLPAVGHQGFWDVDTRAVWARTPWPVCPRFAPFHGYCADCGHYEPDHV